MRVPRKLRATVLAATAIAAIGLTCGEAMASNGVSMSYVGRAAGGGMNASGGASEISAYSPATQRLFVTNGATNKIDIWNLAKPTAPTLITSVTLPSATGVQSVATNGTLVAAAATAGLRTTPPKPMNTSAPPVSCTASKSVMPSPTMTMV